MTPQDRLDTLAAVRAAMPDLDHDTALRIAEWALTGSTPLDPSRVDAAAEVLAGALGKSWAETETQNKMCGIVQRVVTTYMTDPAR